MSWLSLAFVLGIAATPVDVAHCQQTERTGFATPDVGVSRSTTSSRFATEPGKKTRPREGLSWGAGLRAQTTYSGGTWLQLGGDAVIYPHSALGVGITALQGAGPRGSACDSASAVPCGGLYWRTLVPFLEVRLRARSWISPYLRGSVGMVWGRFDDEPTRKVTSALATRSELGLDFHRNMSVRVYAVYERFEVSRVSIGGLGGGIQLGLTL